MAPDCGRLLRRTTFALLVLASAAAETAAVETRPVLSSLGLAAVWVALAAALGLFARPPQDGRRVPPRSVLVLLLVLGAAPFAVEPLRRSWTGEGYPLELQMVFAFRNFGLVLAAFAVWPLCLRLAGIVSLFLMLFAVSLTAQPAVLWLLGLYSATGSAWLMLVYWSGLRHDAPRTGGAVLEVEPASHRLPWVALGFAGAVAGCVLAVGAFGPQHTGRVVAEWLPTSGGTGDSDPFARGGVNDGDDETTGNDPRSTGMVETNQFLDSPLPSLYDLITDMYGEPVKPRELEQAIPLSLRARTRKGEKPPANSLRPEHEFSTARKGPAHPRDPSDRAARALFEVQGRTPLHVRVTAFDSFHAGSWQEAPVNRTTCLLQKEPDTCWMTVQEPESGPIFAGTESHRFKITTSLGSLVPTPPHLLRFRVGRVDRASFFAWGQERILRMAQRNTPSGVIVETDSRTVDPGRLSGVEFPSSRPGNFLRYAAVPADLHPEVAALARRWAEGQPRGWAQIAAVVQHLRAEYEHDPAGHTPEGCDDPLAHFLLHARRGPDYQFASAAVVLLRVLGYPARLASGFYVSPEHYDALTMHTPVVREDLHFWAEVMLPSGDWLVVEPTPGYEVLGPSLPWSRRVLAALLAVAGWLREHLLAAGLSLAGLAAVGWKRRELFDALAATLFRLFPGRSWRRCVRRALWLLEQRGRWAGRGRPASQTPAAWLRAVPPGTGEREDPIPQLTLMAEWCSYAPELTPPWPVSEVRAVCRRVLGVWTLRRWRAVVKAGAGRGGPS